MPEANRRLLSGREYIGVDRIDGPLVFVSGTHAVGYRELIECVDGQGNVRLGIVLLVVLAAVSAVGTIILQDPYETNTGRLRDYYGDTQYDVLKRLSLTNVFAAPWYHALLALLAANVLCVTLSRFSLRPAKWGFLLSHVGVLMVLAGGLAYFALTNFSVWLRGHLYPPTTEGLIACYTAALPFLKNLLLGNLVFSAVLFGVFSWAEHRLPVLRAPAREVA